MGLKYCNDPKAFIENSNHIQGVYENIEEYNPEKKHWYRKEVLIKSDDIISDMISNKKLNLVVTELFITGRKLIISIVFITQSYCEVAKDVRVNTTHLFIIKIPKKREIRETAINNSSDVDFQDFMNLYKQFSAEKYSVLVNYTTSPVGKTIENQRKTIEDQGKSK